MCGNVIKQQSNVYGSHRFHIGTFFIHFTSFVLWCKLEFIRCDPSVKRMRLKALFLHMTIYLSMLTTLASFAVSLSTIKTLNIQIEEHEEDGFGYEREHQMTVAEYHFNVWMKWKWGWVMELFLSYNYASLRSSTPHRVRFLLWYNFHNNNNKLRRCEFQYSYWKGDFLIIYNSIKHHQLWNGN